LKEDNLELALSTTSGRGLLGIKLFK
jgi:hypothetical protein